jgi:hypothetical protein
MCKLSYCFNSRYPGAKPMIVGVECTPVVHPSEEEIRAEFERIELESISALSEIDAAFDRIDAKLADLAIRAANP